MLVGGSFHLSLPSALQKPCLWCGKGVAWLSVCRPRCSLCPLCILGHMLASAPDTETSTNWMGQEVTGATLGIVSVGSSGYKAAQRARALDTRILYRSRRCR